MIRSLNLTLLSLGLKVASETGQKQRMQTWSTAGEFLVRNEPSDRLSCALQHADVGGAISLRPFGDNSHQMLTFTNQVLNWALFVLYC